MVAGLDRSPPRSAPSGPTRTRRSIGFFEDRGIPSVDNVDQPPGKVALVYTLDWTATAASASRTPPTACSRTCSRRVSHRLPRRGLMLSGLLVSALVAAVSLGPWLRRHAADPGWRARTTAARRSRSRRGADGRLLADRARAARGARRPRRPRPARPGAPGLDRLRPRGRPAGAARRRARSRGGDRQRAGLAGPRTSRRSRGASRPGRSRRSARSRSPPTSSPGAGREGIDYLGDLALLLLATNLFNLLDLRPGRVEKAFSVLLAGLCIGAWTIAPLELLGVFVGPVAVVAGSRCASGRCSATRARTWSALWPGSRC